MTAAPRPRPDDELGPLDFLAIEFPGGQLTAAGFERLLSLADQGVVDILDMEFIAKDAEGTRLRQMFVAKADGQVVGFGRVIDADSSALAGRPALIYGSEGWGFESLRARHRNPRSAA